MQKMEFLRGFAGFIKLAYRTSMARRAVKVVLLVSEIAGVLSLAGITLVLVDLGQFPAWAPVTVFGLAATIFVCGVLQGAYVLWFNEGLARSEAEAALLAQSSEAPTGRSGPRVVFRGVSMSGARRDAIHIARGAQPDINLEDVEIGSSGRHGIHFS